MLKQAVVVALATMAIFAGTAVQAAEFPIRNLQGVIMWGAGGSTDSFVRALTPNVEPELGKKIVLMNKPGGAGAIATQYVFSRPADGYTMLFGAENPQLYGVLGLSKLSYKDFYPINVLARAQVVIVARNDTPWKTVKDLVEDAKTRPGKIKMGSTGPGGLPFVMGKLLQTVTGFDVTAVPFKGDGPGLTALLGGHVDFMPVVISACSEYLRAGKLKALAVVDTKPMTGEFNMPALTDDYPAFGQYLPWGPFYGVWVKKGTPDEVKQKLVDAFSTGAKSAKFAAFLKTKEAVLLNIHGDEAQKFLDRWQSTTAWLLHNAGATKVSPAELGIPKPGAAQ